MEGSWHTAPIKATNSWSCKPAKRSVSVHRSHSNSMGNNTSQSWGEPALLRAPEAAVAIQTPRRRQNLAYTSIPLKENKRSNQCTTSNSRIFSDNVRPASKNAFRVTEKARHQTENARGVSDHALHRLENARRVSDHG